MPVAACRSSGQRRMNHIRQHKPSATHRPALANVSSFVALSAARISAAYPVAYSLASGMGTVSAALAEASSSERPFSRYACFAASKAACRAARVLVAGFQRQGNAAVPGTSAMVRYC